MIIFKRIYYIIATMVVLAVCGTIIFFPLMVVKGLDKANRFMDHVALNYTYVDKL